MAWRNCIIMFNSDSPNSYSFYTGNIVTGSVILEFKHKQKVKRIDFKVIGISKAQWTRPSPTVPFLKKYSQKDIIFEHQIDIFSDLCGKTLSSGIRNLPFQFILPENIPSTFQSSIAKVYYFVKLIGRASCRFEKQKIVPFKVTSNVNINNINNYLVPKFVYIEKTLWSSGTFSVRIKTYVAFAPEQKIPFVINIVNHKKVQLTKIVVSLMQKIRYTVLSGWADEERRIHKVEHSKFSKTVVETCQFMMEVPDTIPTSLTATDQMISVSYFLRVEVVFLLHSTLHEDIPVIVAAVPVNHSLSDNMQDAPV